jgi:hypothetical protein
MIDASISVIRKKIHIAIVFGTMLMNSAHGAIPKISVESPLTWLQIVASPDPSFAMRVDEAITPSVKSSIGNILPYSVIVVNAGSENLVGIGIHFQLVKNGTRFASKDFFYHSFNSPNAPLLPPGRRLVFTPSKLANAICGGMPSPGTGGSSSSPYVSSQSYLTELRDLAAVDEIKVSVDLAVTADGRTAGPDRAGTVYRYQQKAQAYLDLRNDCLTRLQRGDSDASLQAWLTPISSQRIFIDSKVGLANSYTLTQKQFAAEWLQYIRGGQRSALESTLTHSLDGAGEPEFKIGALK